MADLRHAYHVWADCDDDAPAYTTNLLSRARVAHEALSGAGYDPIITNQQGYNIPDEED